MTRRQVTYRLQSGFWVRVAGDALRHRDHPPTPQLLAHAAHLTWPDSVLCGPSAVALLGAPLTLSPNIHVIIPTRRKPRLRLTPHTFPVAPGELRRWKGVRVTRPTRSYLDALALLPQGHAQSLFVWAFTRGKLTIADFENHLAHAPGRWGNKRLRQFLTDARAGVMSRAEALAHTILRDARITGWAANVAVSDHVGIIARVDILFEAAKIAVEIDGRRYHGEDRFQSDRTRDNLLGSIGYTVLHFTWEDLTLRPHVVVGTLRTLLSHKPR